MLLEPNSYVITDNTIFSSSDYNTSRSNIDTFPFGIQTNYRIALNQDYNDALPSSTIYEPFTQISYWERQEINTNLGKLQYIL